MSDDLLGSLMAAKDASVEALGVIWGPRGFRRRTHGDPNRTRTLVALEIMAQELGLPRCGDLAEVMAEAWAGEAGWDTTQLIKALGATKGAAAAVVHDHGRSRRGDAE